MALERTVRDWVKDKIEDFEYQSPTSAFAARTVLQWIRNGPDGLTRAVERTIEKPPSWDNDIVPFISPWLDPFPTPLENVKDPLEIGGPDSRFIRVSGVRLHYIQAWPEEGKRKPNAPALVLLHGFNGCTFSWRHVMQELANEVGGRVIAFDRPPFGLSERPTKWKGGLSKSPYSASMGVNLTTALTRALGLGKYVLVGHSAGAPIAAEASAQSDRCKGLVLVAPAVSLPKKDKLGDDKGDKSENDQADKNDQAEDDLVSKEEATPSAKGITADEDDIDGNTQNTEPESKVKEWPLPAENFAQILRVAYTSAVIRVPGVGIQTIRMFTEKQAEELRKKGVNYPVPFDDSPKTVAEGYLKPLQSKDWDVGILEHYRALLAEGGLLAPGPCRSDLPEKVLIVQGADDVTVPRWVAEAYAEAHGGPKRGMIYECYEDVGHLPMEQAPDRFVKSVAEYCKDI